MEYDYDLAIIGGSASGLAAAIYGARAGLSTTVFEEKLVGGQTATSPEIENYPGFPRISGMDLSEKFKEHATQYVQVREMEGVDAIEKLDDGFRLKTAKGEYDAAAVILATGARHRHLMIPGEKDFFGRGVSVCATCDGFFFKDKKALVVGGGNTAVTEALYLKGAGVDVRLVHRRDKLRAEEALQQKLEEAGVPVIWNAVVTQIYGGDFVEGAKLVSTVDDKTWDEPTDAVFVAIGILPNNELARQLGVELDDSGSVLTDRHQRTNVKGVYACGDLCGEPRQIVTGAAQGAIAALTAGEMVGKQYPY